MGLQTPQHTHAQTFLQGLLKGRKYHAARLVLFVLACLLISVAIFMLSFSNPQASRTQQLAANMIQTEARAEVLLIASYDDADSATQMQRDALIDLLNRSSVGVDVEYLDVNAGSTSRNVSDASTYGASLATSSWGRLLPRRCKITAVILRSSASMMKLSTMLRLFTSYFSLRRLLCSLE